MMKTTRRFVVMTLVAISELKAHCLRLVDEVARRRREIVITKRGKPIARVVPLDDIPPDDALTRPDPLAVRPPQGTPWLR